VLERRSPRLMQTVRTTNTRPTSHFLYVPDRAAAERAGKALARAGFRSEAGPASDGDDWLVIATHDEVAKPDREVATQEAMREIAIAVGGQYNGYAVRGR
jgi:hypothetical protein